MKFGSTEWTHKVQNAIKYLIHFAETTPYKKGLNHTFISYGDFEGKIGLPIKFSDMTLFLEEVCYGVKKSKLTTDDILLSALVATEGTGMPGSGFFSLAKKIGFSSEALKDKSHFAQEQRRRVFEHYQNKEK